MTIYDIKYRTLESSPYFFTRKTLKFFGQTMRDFKIKKQIDGRYLIRAKMYTGPGGNFCGYTKRYFNPVTNELERD